MLSFRVVVQKRKKPEGDDMAKTTRKLFRMGYEPCNGLCYAPSDVVNVSLLAEDVPRYERLKTKMLAIHEPACGDVNIRYALDMDEESGLFIATFVHYGKVEMMVGKHLVETLEDFCDYVASFWASPAGVSELQAGKGLGHAVCEHGHDEDLSSFMDKHSGVFSNAA